MDYSCDSEDERDKLRIYSGSRFGKICYWFHWEEKEGIKYSLFLPEQLGGWRGNLLRRRRLGGGVKGSNLDILHLTWHIKGNVKTRAAYEYGNLGNIWVDTNLETR